MNRFFTSLIDRHLDRCDTIQPRTPGLFEPDHGDMTSPFPDEPANPPEDEPVRAEHFSRESSMEKKHPPEPAESGEAFTSPSFRAQEIASAEPDIPIQQRPSPFSHEPRIDSLLNSGMQIDPVETGLTEKTEMAPGKNMDIPVEEPQKKRPVQSVDNANIGSEFSHHIRATVQRLAGEPGIQKREHKKAVQAGQQSPQQNSSVTSERIVPVPKQNVNREKENLSEPRENSAWHNSLEPPSWLPEIEARFSHHLQAKKKEPEPVINVTIGRIEVRAVQTETPRQKPQPQKPTGVMTLDEYLKQREGGDSR